MASAPAPAPAPAGSSPEQIDIKPLLARLWPQNPDAVTADDIANAVALFFTNQLSEVQAASLLMCLHVTGLDRTADVIAGSAVKMRLAAARIDVPALAELVKRRGRPEGAYGGGLCDIVGTGGDSHNTFNISTTSSILASSLLLLAKHGNRASTSKSGSADLLHAMQPQPPNISAVNPETLSRVYAAGNYAFLFAPIFHPGMRFVAPVRRQLPWRTLFNLLGPLANPVDVVEGEPLLEARVVGVARRELGPVFAEALRLAGVHKAMVVCGEEELDEISCAGPTLCWRLAPAQGPGAEPEIERFTLTPADFGLPAHPLADVSPGKSPEENAALLRRILTDDLPGDDPILDFVLMNTAALFVVSGICEADASDMGHGDDGNVVRERGPAGGRWKEGVRRARWAIKSGEAWRQWKAFVEVTNSFGPAS